MLDIAEHILNRHLRILPRKSRDDRDLPCCTAFFREDGSRVAVAFPDPLLGRLGCARLGRCGHGASRDAHIRRLFPARNSSDFITHTARRAA